MKKKNIPQKPKKDLDSYSYHEALDRVYFVSDIIDRILLSHSVINKHKAFKKEVEKINNKLYDLYITIGFLEEKKYKHEKNKNIKK